MKVASEVQMDCCEDMHTTSNLELERSSSCWGCFGKRNECMI
jgi:hypothetical protein